MRQDISIGEAAKVSGVKVPTIRYYEQIGLLPTPPRTDGNRRLYHAQDVRRLAFIHHARELGFGVTAIRTLLILQDEPGQSCAAADAIAHDRLAEVKHRIASLSALKAELERMVAGCAHGRVEQCRVIEILADHRKCVHADHGLDQPILSSRINSARNPTKNNAVTQGRSGVS
jgi:DNA-binding transcriptional MerR regulator